MAGTMTLLRGDDEIAIIDTDELKMWLERGWVTEEARAEELAKAADAKAKADADAAAKAAKNTKAD